MHMQKTEVEKLEILLPHWIDHNTSHIEEMKKWVDIARKEGKNETADAIEKAIAGMHQTSKALSDAMTKMTHT